ncbi:amino acid ABC transporter permease [Vineibacter terrae]|uniref:Amino acid ABC transporter permease n=1 Tax=Vineibacter terrae TaxID=2586908 RepID=A0A5C8PU18_9HYPH|nr:amino acid ABC transporter permease [Vineibacter terrae]TXL81571.1 amino acid ABC transporter permease [Vineibacter terrae]
MSGSRFFSSPRWGSTPRATLFCRDTGLPFVDLRWPAGILIVATFLLVAFNADAQSGAARSSVYAILWKWTPLLFQGFCLNLLMSALAMAFGTILGALLGLAQISLLPPVRTGSWALTQVLRNSPWLVTIFYIMYLVPFEVKIGGTVIPLPDWIKATFGFTLPVMANVSEIVRGAIRSIPATQWEAARSLAFTRRQTLWMIIIPQCLKRMLPPWMNLYSILTMGTVLANIVGVSESLTIVRDVLASERRTDLLMPMYAYILVWFFLYIYPISVATVRLERKWSVKG